MFQNTHAMRDAVSASGEMTVDWGPQGLQITDGRPRPVWGRITGVAAGTNRYSWTQVNESDSTLPDLGSGFASSGTTDVGQWPAYEVNGTTTVAVGTKVYLWPSPSGQFWMFCGCSSSSGGGPFSTAEGTGSGTLSSTSYSSVAGVTLPATGQYLILASMSAQVQISAWSSAGSGIGAGVAGRIRNDTTGTTLAGHVVVAWAVALDVYHNSHTLLSHVFSGTSGHSITIQMARHDPYTGTTFTSSDFSCSIRYVRWS